MPHIEYDAILQRVAVDEVALKELHGLLEQRGAQIAMPPEGTPMSSEGNYLLSYKAAQSIIGGLSGHDRRGISPLERRLERAARALVSAAMSEAIAMKAATPEDDEGARMLYSAFSNEVVLDFEEPAARQYLQISD